MCVCVYLYLCVNVWGVFFVCGCVGVWMCVFVRVSKCTCTKYDKKKRNVTLFIYGFRELMKYLGENIILSIYLSMDAEG